MNLVTEGIRQKKLVVEDVRRVEQLLQTAQVGYLGLVDGDTPYVVPLNFVWYDDAVYLHGAAEGRKATLMHASPKATFTVCQELGILAHPVPAKTDTAYMSAMVFGRVSAVEELAEATNAMDAMLGKYVPGYFQSPLHQGHVASYVSGMGSHVKVYRLNADEITAKENPVDMSKLFYPGRTQSQDARDMARP